MDIESIGAQFLNSPYVPMSSSGPLETGEPGAFRELLLKSQATQTQTGLMHTPSVSGKIPVDKDSKLYGLCLELETFLIKNLLKSMRNTVQKSNLIDTGFAGEVYEDMLYDEYAKEFAKNAGFGLAEQAYLELTGQRYRNSSISVPFA